MLKFNSKLSLFAGAVVWALFLAGCTQPVATDGTSEVQALATKLPFAYDATVDQIAHMSCSAIKQDSSGNADTGMYFTLRAGAYRSGGLMLNDAFYASIGAKPLAKQTEVLTMSPANTGSVLQLSIRARQGFQTLLTRTGTPVAGQDYANLLNSLGVPDTTDALVNLPQNSRLKFMRSGRAGGYRMEGSVVFSDNYTLWNDMRDKLTNRMLLALTYVNGGTGKDAAYSARAPIDVGAGTATRDAAVYGLGFYPTFDRPTVTANLPSNYPMNVLTRMTETHLESTSTAGLGSWTCPVTMQLRIIRYEDGDNALANCRKMPDPTTGLDASTQFTLSLIRNQFKVEDWYVDLINKCIIPKKSVTSCYGSVTQVAYSLGDACSTSGDPTLGPACQAYASICYRN